MVGTYDVALLQSDQIERAYPLIQAAVPALDLASWHRMASDAFRREEILVAVNPRRYIQGLSIYRHFKHPILGALLDVIFLCATSAADEYGVAEGLFASINSRAKELKCAGVRFWNQDSDNWQRMRDETQFNRLDHGLMVCVADRAR
ncbi:hypothetical protein CCGE525_33660 (plasmid) [Rhizobium jaguaris]|uniref:GNAT family N-acetyltransferase n=1 Tax=Rhizobium jaguaris TaxID=1312183 RepID=A0A387G2K0_9HYPH|nr:hypothetical protein CCGE525_33660 [Rhizobium jaguaris]